MIKKNVSSKKIKATIAICVALIAVLSFLGGYFAHYLIKGSDVSSAAWIVSVIENNYCVYDEETGEVKEFDAEDYAEALVTLLDKYSSYYTPEEYSDVVSTSKGNNYGIGLAFLVDQTDCTVFKVTGNSPADRVGIKSGDVVTRGVYEGVDRTFSDSSELLSFLSGCGKQSITLYVQRNGTPLTFTLKKEAFTTAYVTYFDNEVSGKFRTDDSGSLTLFSEPDSEMNCLASDTAYISLSQFEGGASEQIGKALAFMRERKKTKLIFDLRDNGGGYMTKLSEIASYFVYADDGEKCLVATVKDKNGNVERFESTSDFFDASIEKITVLANENTASASECLIGAMLYYGRAFGRDGLIIEKNSQGVAKTYGKGIMQTTFLNVYTGEALKLTTAYVFQPDGKTSIHGKGFTPTVENAVEKGFAVARAIEVLKD